jgi:predicted PurR-regulated permease PerM
VAEDLARVLPDAAQLAARGNLGDVVVVIYLTGKLAYRMLDILLMIAVSGFLGVPFPLLWALWVGIVDFLPMIGGALAGIPTVLFALAHSLTAGLVTAAVFVAYQQLENHVLNPLIMSRTVNVSPLLVLMAVLLGTSLGDWAGGVFGGFVAALISVPCGALFVMRLNGWDRALKSPRTERGLALPGIHPNRE